MSRAPFQQLPFAALPALPRIPHPYFSTPARELSLHSTAFGDVRVHCRVHGSGPPLLLVHGLMTSSYSFRYVLEPLGQHFTVYVPDLPGSGRSSMPDRSYHPDRYAEFLGELIDALGIRGCRTVGNSLGGYLAMRLALRDRGAMSRLLNLHSPGIPLPRLHALRMALGLPLSESVLQRVIALHPERWVQRNVHYYDETLKSREETREYGAPLSTRAGRHAFHRILKETLDVREMTAFEAQLCARRERGARFPVPLMLMYAERDPMVPPEVGERMRALVPDAEFVKLREGSHFAHVDAPRVFLESAVPFLRGADGDN
ncbi:MAG: alpha/beta hydrolase [Sandaracinaceae bacterium]|jgi:pimeloyl-ACP methyl ester carboxylesterase|nr:alpha/beta hydrolase [Sandaracinaceae bacterium]MBP7681346.1 alpha/beta hydrolase [Deltaproteobacteria bacterium]MBK6807721.1 alpha/beta hydrolase [Sandaracinaceae bacterium]MBK7155156.1 alpha/beta hydrolase [Sandaracinaceae bacterium]MBK7776238.1 alpha/beta hydrolase [Sandaracinaceae bacterium]